jgi:plastocyanin
VPFSFDSGNGYIDPVSGNFSTFAQVKDGILLPGQSFNFTFTRPGNYSYYGIPGPFIQGTVIVLLPSQP